MDARLKLTIKYFLIFKAREIRHMLWLACKFMAVALMFIAGMAGVVVLLCAADGGWDAPFICIFLGNAMYYAILGLGIAGGAVAVCVWITSCYRAIKNWIRENWIMASHAARRPEDAEGIYKFRWRQGL